MGPELARSLDGLGFAVDVMHYLDMRRLPARSYGLLLGMGSASHRLARELPARVLKLFYGTGSAPDFNNRAEKQRLDALGQRRGRMLEARCMVTISDETLAAYDAALCLGNAITAGTYGDSIPVHVCNNFGYDGLKKLSRNPGQAREHFLYFASRAHVHKGLDLLLEVFSAIPNLHLHVCGDFRGEPDFTRLYRSELFETPNIHFEGWLEVPGPRFLEMCRCCAYTILPSCAEGQPGSIIACMQTGLIPVLSRHAGIDTDDFGILLPSCRHDDIARTVRELAARPTEWIAGKSARSSAICGVRHTRDAFRERVQGVLRGLLGSRSQRA